MGSAVIGAQVLSFTMIAAAQAATVYIPEGSAGQVLVVDSETDKVVQTISGLPEIHGLGGSPGSPYLVAGSLAETSRNETVEKPQGMAEDEHAAHHGGGKATMQEGDGSISLLTIVSAADGSPVAKLEVSGAVHHVAVSPDGRYAVATHPGEDGVSIVDLPKRKVLSLVRTGPMPNYAAFSPDGSRVYVSNSGNGTVSEIDTESWIVRRNLMAGDSPEHLAMAPDGGRLYVANVVAGLVTALSLEKDGEDRTYEIGGELHGLDLSDDGATLFVSAKSEDKVVAVDVESGEMRSAPLAPAPYHLTVIPGSGKLYVSSRDEPKVWVVDQASLAPRNSIGIDGEGHQMVALP
ncbi:YncE family protein [Lutibaculum baratangense]|uniref:Uncharacterized protein n=1 Tax=Lutibaculum baratangense AMV1 TaxID=631454 RepID=V4TP40_9HYPH|nr:YncE family protein [Lutibaculum baratangense]ESR27448.1 hypothetical protein N177_0052 [Lutibaculum baratangense AMV1]